MQATTSRLGTVLQLYQSKVPISGGMRYYESKVSCPGRQHNAYTLNLWITRRTGDHHTFYPQHF